MVQASSLDGLVLYSFPLEQDSFASSVIDISGCEVIQAFMVALVVVGLDEGTQLRLEVAGQIVVFKQDAVLERLMPALDFTLRLWMARGTADMLHFPGLQPFGQIGCDVARAVIREQPRPVAHARRYSFADWM